MDPQFLILFGQSGLGTAQQATCGSSGQLKVGAGQGWLPERGRAQTGPRRA
jgi:hypothetical protein